MLCISSSVILKLFLCLGYFLILNPCPSESSPIFSRIFHWDSSHLQPNNSGIVRAMRYDPETSQYYVIGQQGPCKSGQAFYPVDDHEGICDCKMMIQPLLYWPSTDECYPLNVRGPCPDGYWITWNGQEAECQTIPDGCLADGKHVYWNASLEQTSECYKLGEQGPCETGKFLERKNLDIFCSEVHIRYVAQASSRDLCPAGSKRSRSKRCVAQFRPSDEFVFSSR